MTSSCIACCIFHILRVPLICSDTASRVAEAMIGAKVRILCFTFFALFLEFGARTRPQDLFESLGFSHLGNRAKTSDINPRRNSSQ